MNLIRYQHRRAEEHPFRQIATTSFITGTLAIILGLILLYTVKNDFITQHQIKAAAKIIAALCMIVMGIRMLIRGYMDEYKFDLNEAYNPGQGEWLNKLMGQRSRNGHKLSVEYANMMHSKSYALTDNEKRPITKIQKIFYELLSKGKISKVIDGLPYPITNFIVNQSSPLAMVAGFVLTLCGFFFLSWLGLFPVNMFIINLLIFTGLLSLWRPSPIDDVLQAKKKKDLRGKMILFIAAFLITLGLYNAYKVQINGVIFISVLFLAAIIIVTAILAFRVIDSIFSVRSKVQVELSRISNDTYRANTQPNNILQQFDNIVKAETGWFFKELTKDARGLLAGDQNRKGDFGFEYIYETDPKRIASPHDAKSENLLRYSWILGTILLSVGLIFFFLGILTAPNVDMAALQEHPEQVLSENAFAIFLSLLLTLFGIAIYFFGGKLVYEIYMFFHTEIFFESDLILFGASGNYDEFEQITGNIKRKDTCTDYTPDIKICRITSSVFMYPYIDQKSIVHQPRFIVKIEKNDPLLNKIWQKFRDNMNIYDANGPFLP